MLITFYKKYLKPDEPDFNIILFICSSDVVSIDNLPPDLAYFFVLNSSTRKRSLHRLMVFFSLSTMVEMDGKSEP